MSAPFNLIAVIGPTASGKTSFAAHLADEIDGEVISADSRQVYRNMNLGTGKDYEDYRVQDRQVPFHLIDIIEPGNRYSVFEFQRDFFKAFDRIRSQGKMPILCGGSGMYIEAATRGYRLVEVPRNDMLRHELQFRSLQELEEILAGMKTLHNRTDVDTVDRAVRAIEIESYYRANPGSTSGLPAVYPLFFGIMYDRTTERSRITERLESRLKRGMVSEVQQLLASGITPESLDYYGLEYRYITAYLTGRLDYPTMVKQLNTAIHQFARRQRTWFRKMERNGIGIHWIDGAIPLEKKLETVRRMLDRC
ncbi:MAG TPA: tRNA (adenosine(37)-N6)-dimethylallyltransferase MiaA [Bacteroidales bacterium]|nr:tRNA (adenosine(37)-N6)-dimethylallyltransferase MiaA [Bacteroidales bacterium]